MADKVQIIGGAFQDSEGNVLDSGWLTMELNQDEQAPSTGQVASGIELRVPLDEDGNIQTSPAIEVWPNDVLIPTGSYYIVNGFTSRGQHAWGPFYGQVLSTPDPFDVTAWVPMGTAGATVVVSPVLQTNGVNNANQALLNLKNGTNVTIVNSGGDVTISASGGGTGVGFNGNVHNLHLCVASRSQFGNQLGCGFGQASGQGLTFDSPTATEPILAVSQTNNFGSDHVYISDTGATAQAYTLGVLIDAAMRVRTLSSTTVRYWIGAGEGNTANYPTELKTNTPTTGFVGFRYSTTAGDTTYKCIGTDGIGITIVDSLIAVDNVNSHVFEIRPATSGTSVKYYIDGTLVATISTNLPTAGAQLNSVVWCDNTATTNAVTVNTGFLSYETI